MLFSISGTIASGKTTYIAALKQSFGESSSAVVFEEPVEEWKEYFDNLQANFTKDTVYSLQAKIYEYYHSVLVHIRKDPTSLVFMERSHIENIFCFMIPIASGLGRLEPRMVKLINKLLDEYHEITTLTRVNVLYLPILSPDALTKRAATRNQPNDKYLDKDFFENHVEIYKNFMSFTAIEGNTPKIYGDFLPNLHERKEGSIKQLLGSKDMGALWSLAYNTKDFKGWLDAIVKDSFFAGEEQKEFVDFVVENTEDF